MELSIRTRDVELTDALREQITRRLEFAFDTFEDHIEDAFVYLIDLNGPKGGVDKLCQIIVRARGLGELPFVRPARRLPAAMNGRCPG